MLSEHTVEDEREIRRLAGVIESRGPIRFGATPAEDHQIGRPAATLRFAEESRDIV
jgi:hypothetical protein